MKIWIWIIILVIIVLGAWFMFQGGDETTPVEEEVAAEGTEALADVEAVVGEDADSDEEEAAE
jgi:hypothetical protein